MRHWLYITIVALALGCGKDSGTKSTEDLVVFEPIYGYRHDTTFNEHVWWLDCEGFYKLLIFSGVDLLYDSRGVKHSDGTALRVEATRYSKTDSTNLPVRHFDYNVTQFENYVVFNGSVYTLVDAESGSTILGDCNAVDGG